MANSKYYTEQEMWKTFPENPDIDKRKFLLIIKTFFYLLMKSVIDEGKVYFFPNKLGIFGTFKSKTKPKMVDFSHFKKTGQTIFRRNLHTHGLMTKTTWIMRWPKFDVGDASLNNVFRYKCTRDFNRYLASKIKNENTINKYYDYDN